MSIQFSTGGGWISPTGWFHNSWPAREDRGDNCVISLFVILLDSPESWIVNELVSPIDYSLNWYSILILYLYNINLCILLDKLFAILLL